MPFKNTTLAGFCSSSRAYNVTVFSAVPNGPKRATRRKLDAKDRAKVHAVRRTGACLTCRMLKVPCDIPDPENPGPCKRCLTIASKPQQKGLLAFRECIRTKIRDVNIFQHTLDIDYTSLQSPKLLSLVSKTVDRTDGVSSLSLPEMLSSIFTWMVPKQGKSPERSIVGALICSDQFRQLVQNDSFLGGELLERFRVMIYSSTLAYVYDSGSREIYDSDLTMRDLHRITYAMGSDLLLFLDNALVPHQLAKLSQEQLSGLFVVIFGIALAVAYSTAVYDSPTFNAGVETGGETPRTLWHALQQHLSQMLAHHLVILGARLGLVLRGDSEKEIISSLMSAIIYRGNFVWVAQQRAVELPEASSSQTTPLTETTENTEQLFILNIPEDEAKVDPTTGALGVKKLDSYRSTPVSVRSLQTIQNTLKPIMPSSDDEETNELMCHNESTPDPPRLGSSRRFCQTARKSNSRATRNTSRNASMPPVSYCANKIAGRKFKGRSRQSHPEPQRSSSQTSNPTVTSKNTPEMSQATTNSSTTSTNGYGGITSSNNDATISSTTSSTNPPSLFEPLGTDLDLDMDLSSDPFGIGWLPEPEQEPEPKLPETLPTVGATTKNNKNDNNNISLTPSVWGVQSQAASPSIWGVQNTGIPPSLQHLIKKPSSHSLGSPQTGPYIRAYQGSVTNRTTKSPTTNTIATPNNPTKRVPTLWACQEPPRAKRRQPKTASTNTAGLGSYSSYPPLFNSTSQQAVPSPPPQPQPPTTDNGNPGTTTSQSSAPFIWASQEIDNIDFTNPPNPSNPSRSSICTPPAWPLPARDPSTHTTTNNSSSTSVDTNTNLSANMTSNTRSSTYPEAPYIHAPQSAAEFLSPSSSEDDEQIKEITLPGSMYHYRLSSGSNNRPRKKQKTDNAHVDDWTQVKNDSGRRFVQNCVARRRWKARAEEKAKTREQEQQQPPQLQSLNPQSSPAQEETLDEDPHSKPPPIVWSPQTAVMPYVPCANMDITPYPVSRAPGLSSEPASADPILLAGGVFDGDEDGDSNNFYNLYDANSYFGPVKKRPVI